MKKVWIYKRKNIKGWWCAWYESGKRKSKDLPSKELAEHFKKIKYTQLNSDVFTGLVSVGLEQMVSECLEAKKIQGVTERPVKSLNDTQVKRLLESATPYPPMKMRILLAFDGVI